jgi:phage gpG-like protein
MAEHESVAVDVRELRTVLAELTRNAQNLPDLMPSIAEALVAAVQSEFETEGRGAWPPLAPSTIAARRGGGGGAKILQDTGLFAGSITPAFGPDWAQAFTNVPYAIFHTSDKPRTKIPYRNPFDIDEAAVLEEVVGMVQRALVL